MNIILQNENNVLNLETQIIKDIVQGKHILFNCTEMSLSEMQKNYNPNMKNSIPIGSIDFVTDWMMHFYNHGLNPIEIPKCLRTDEFLKRDYKIVSADELPMSGKYFIKDVSKLKAFSSNLISDISYLNLSEIIKSPEFIANKSENDFNLYLDNTHLFEVSELVNILSEWRVYFIDGKIENIGHYNGNVKYFPDIDLLEKANAIYSIQKDYPKSFTMDVMVTNKGTSIIEIHPFTSVGLYCTLWSDKLIYAYKDGIDYYINHNTPIEK